MHSCCFDQIFPTIIIISQVGVFYFGVKNAFLRIKFLINEWQMVTISFAQKHTHDYKLIRKRSRIIIIVDRDECVVTCISTVQLAIVYRGSLVHPRSTS